MTERDRHPTSLPHPTLVPARYNNKAALPLPLSLPGGRGEVPGGERGGMAQAAPRHRPQDRGWRCQPPEHLPITTTADVSSAAHANTHLPGAAYMRKHRHCPCHQSASSPSTPRPYLRGPRPPTRRPCPAAAAAAPAAPGSARPAGRPLQPPGPLQPAFQQRTAPRSTAHACAPGA